MHLPAMCHYGTPISIAGPGILSFFGSILPERQYHPKHDLDLHGLLALPLLDLQQQRAVDVRQHTTKGDGGADKRVEFFVTTDGQLQVARRDALNLQILGRIASQLEHFGSQVFEDGGKVYSGFSSDARALPGDVAKVSLYATAGKLRRDYVITSFLSGASNTMKRRHGELCRDVARHVQKHGFSLTCRPAFAECDLDVLTFESPLPPVLPPVLPV